MTLPKPAIITTQIETLIDDLHDINTNYQWLHGWAHAQPTTDRPYVTTSHISDPTANAVEHQDAIRHELHAALKHLLSAHGNITNAWRATARAHDHQPRDNMNETLAGENLPKHEHNKLVAAQARRIQRGEGWGNA